MLARLGVSELSSELSSDNNGTVKRHNAKAGCTAQADRVWVLQAGKYSAAKDQALRENAILKRAVAIQHTRMKEAADKDQQHQQLRQMLSQYEERCRTLEAANYSLNLHLKAATSAQHVMGGRPPDVY